MCNSDHKEHGCKRPGDGKEECKDNYKKEYKYEDDGCCVCVNIYCDKCEKDVCYKKEGKDKEDKSCVSINIFCDEK